MAYSKPDEHHGDGSKKEDRDDRTGEKRNSGQADKKNDPKKDVESKITRYGKDERPH